MSDIAIKVENLSKRFQIGTASRPAYHRLSEAIAGAPQFLWNACRGLVPGSSIASPGSENLATDPSEFWALKDVSFEVKQGEVVGIIGRNGAGKSTLLKILSRITEPTSGRFGVRGRVASLLEVGTGFHPELTGRENIYVSGVTLGMSRSEIHRRFDEIVEFSGVEKFLETPVKHYSSGMQVRLGFAVAAHLESEILVIDEVLAVGDAEFQKKCLSRMRDLHNIGRSVLVVSHQLSTINTLCDRGVVLASGVVEFVGSARDAISHYQPGGSNRNKSIYDADAIGKRIGNEKAVLHRAWTENSCGEVAQDFDLKQSITIRMEYSILKPAAKFHFPNFHVYDEQRNPVFVTTASANEFRTVINSEGRWVASCVIPENLLNSGMFFIGVAITSIDPGVEVAFFEQDLLVIEVTEDVSQTINESRNNYAGPIPGPLRPLLKWQITRATDPETAS